MARARRRVKRVTYGWWVAVAGAFNMMFSSGPTFQASSALFAAIDSEFGWSRAVVTGVASFGRFGGALLGPVEGWMSDRFGPARMVLLGFTLGGLGLIAFSMIQGPVAYYAAFLLISVGFSIGGFTPSMVSVNAWLPKRRATGMAMVVGGSSIGGFSVPLIVWGINSYGWRPTVLVIGLMTMAVGPFIAWVLARKAPLPEEMEPADEDDDASTLSAENPRLRPAYDFTVKQAMRTRAFWSMSLTHTLANLSVSAVSAHVFLQLLAIGLSDGLASTIIPIMGVTAFTSQMLGGILGDRMDKRIPVSILLLFQGAGVALLAVASSYPTAVLFAIVWGVGFGARTPMLHAMRGEYFGRRHYGTILGMSSFPMAMGMMITPFTVGYIFDVQETYRWSFLVLAGACVLASALILLAKRPAPPAQQHFTRPSTGPAEPVGKGEATAG
ncbi:MAG: MFS transporter [Dehalococcoidia bacterium]